MIRQQAQEDVERAQRELKKSRIEHEANEVHWEAKVTRLLKTNSDLMEIIDNQENIKATLRAKIEECAELEKQVAEQGKHIPTVGTMHRYDSFNPPPMAPSPGIFSPDTQPNVHSPDTELLSEHGSPVCYYGATADVAPVSMEVAPVAAHPSIVGGHIVVPRLPQIAPPEYLENSMPRVTLFSAYLNRQIAQQG